MAVFGGGVFSGMMLGGWYGFRCELGYRLSWHFSDCRFREFLGEGRELADFFSRWRKLMGWGCV
jgi:hypothetical protein